MEELIQNVSADNILKFFRNKISSFKPDVEDLTYTIKTAEFEKFTDVNKIGEAKFQNAEDLLIFTAKVTNDLTERSSKKAQFEIAKKILKQDFKDGAIFIFYDEEGNFRFSFIRRNYGDKENKFTNWKRYTYFVDKTNTNKTFIDRIGNCSFISLDEIQEAFSVEKLNKEFYQKIAKAFYSLIGGKIKLNTKEEEFKLSFKMPGVSTTDKKTHQEFAVRLVGRTIFCWFLKNKKSENGLALLPEGWLSSKVVDEVNNNQHNYYHSIVEKLFFEVLNQKIDDRIKNIPDGHENIPYLNGGLFEPIHEDFYEIDKKQGISKHLNTLLIKNSWFIEFFEVLEQYNFTIDENSINDSEVSIDPEMLGTIFENLLAEIDPDTEKSARKSTGSFYTPREIVDYMVEQSLVQYLKTKTGIEDDELLLKLFDDSEVDSLSQTQIESILESISEVKILDPACGSGAFPMGALHKIVKLLQKLDKGAVWWKKKQLEKAKHLDSKYYNQYKEKIENANSDYARKLGVIQHSIYGVDIQPIAAEISKLRSFLSLIIDENINDEAPNRGIEPLPNLEFKFVTANTLIGLDEGVSKAQGSVATGSLDFGETTDLQVELQNLRNSYLQANPQEKESLRKEFEKIQIAIFKQESKGSAPSKRAIQLTGWKPFSHDSSTWFDPEWMFGILKFDLIIGNPPYIDSETMINNGLRDFRDYLVKNFRCTVGNWDLYIPFFEIGHNLLNEDGILSYITPNKWLSIKYALTFRENYNNNLFQIVNCNDIKVFDAGVTPVISFFSKIIVNKIIVNKYINNYELLPLFEIDNTVIDNNLGILLSNNSNILIKLMENDSVFENYLVCENPFSTSEAYKLIKIIGNNEDDKYSFRLTNTGTIDPFVSLWGQKNTSYLKNKYLHPTINSKIFKVEFPKRFEQTISRKIIIAGMRYLECFYDCKGKYVAGKSTLIIRNITDDNYEFFTCLLNSKLIFFYIKESYSSMGIDGGISFNADMIHKLPIPNLDKAFVNLIHEVYIKILQSEYESSSFYEQLNLMNIYFYRFYNLSYEEVLAIEPNFINSSKEYASFVI